MQIPNSDASPNYAQRVCRACKARKRRCNKALPKCSSCFRKNLTCEYSNNAQRRSSAAVAVPPWYQSVVHSDRELSYAQPIGLPTITFLDPGILQYGYIETYRPQNTVPAVLLNLLSDQDELHTITTKFFKHINPWMPFISKKRFHELHVSLPFESKPETVLLLLSLKLLTTLPPTEPRNARTSLYYTVKHFSVEVVDSNFLSVAVLQALLILALYELGHGIYPAVFLTIGTCARYAHALDIKVGKVQNARKVLSLIEVEERRRVWWAIVILDRFVSIGAPGRPLTTANPTIDDLLPSDDEAFNQGIVRPSDTFSLSSPMNSHMSKFALLCQAARLLGQVLELVSKDPPRDDAVWLQLERTLQSMINASLEVEKPDLDQITFVYSSLVALYAPWLHGDNAGRTDPNLSQRAKTIIQQIMEKMTTNLVEKLCFVDRDPEDMSFWGFYFAYHICATNMASETRSPAEDKIVRSIKEALIAIDVRWNAAGAYLQLLEAREVISKF